MVVLEYCKQDWPAVRSEVMKQPTNNIGIVKSMNLIGAASKYGNVETSA